LALKQTGLELSVSYVLLWLAYHIHTGRGSFLMSEGEGSPESRPTKRGREDDDEPSSEKRREIEK